MFKTNTFRGVKHKQHTRVSSAPNRAHSAPKRTLFGSSATKTRPRKSLVEPLASVPPQRGNLKDPVYKQSELPNGLKVISVSDDRASGMVSLNLHVAVGSRYETGATSGSSYFLKRMAFKSTNKDNEVRTQLNHVRVIEALAANYTVSVGREHIQFEAQVPSENVEAMVQILAESLHPRLIEWEVRDEREHVAHNAEHDLQNPEVLLFERLHAEAFRHKGLGQPIVCPQHNIPNITETSLAKFIQQYYTAPRMTLVATGSVEHAQLFGAAETHLVTEQGGAKEPPIRSPYVGGGEAFIPYHGDSHILLAFNGVGLTDKDLLPLGILQHILGSGGPGNAKTSRLNRNIIEKNSWAQEVSAFNINYTDAGVFGVYGVTERPHAKDLLLSLTREFTNLMQTPVEEQELNRAKAQLKSSLLINQTMPSLAEFVAKQSTVSNPLSPQEFLQPLDSITPQQIQSVAKKVFSSRPTLAALGEVSDIYGTEELHKVLS